MRARWQDKDSAPSPTPTVLDETQATGWGAMSISSVLFFKNPA